MASQKMPSEEAVIARKVRRPKKAIDVVIAASLASDAELSDKNVEARVSRDRDNGELKYTLRALANNAPWVGRIYLLVNGAQELPSWVPEPEKTVMLDRCTLLPKGTCPTRNGFTAMSVVHKVPGLSRQFIYSDDDILLAQPADFDDFFVNGSKPYCFMGDEELLTEDIYQNSNEVAIEEKHIPSRVTWNPHIMRPLDRLALEKFEKRYSTWLSFMRSHRAGRWCSAHAYGTQECEDSNSMEEDMGPIWEWWLHQTRSCIEGRLVSKRVKQGQMNFKSLGVALHGKNNKETKTPYTVENLRKQFTIDPKFFVNINDDLPMNAEEVEQTGTTYDDARNAQDQVLGEQFPPPNVNSI